jgi:hypothetical protein
MPWAVPATVGLKTIWNWQLSPAPSVDGQLFVWLNALVIEIDEMVTSWCPMFVKIAACAVLVVPTSCVA